MSFLLFEVETHQCSADKFALCYNFFLVGRGECIPDRLPESTESVQDIIYGFLLDAVIFQQYHDEIYKLEFKSGYFVVCFVYFAVE